MQFMLVKIGGNSPNHFLVIGFINLRFAKWGPRIFKIIYYSPATVFSFSFLGASFVVVRVPFFSFFLMR